MYNPVADHIPQSQNDSEISEWQADKLESLKKTYRFAGKDSMQFTNIKIILSTILNLKKDNPLSKKYFNDPKRFIHQITLLYNSLISNCEFYLNSHKHPWTGVGKARKALISQILESAIKERSCITTAVYYCIENAPNTYTFASVLAIIRSKQIDITNRTDIFVPEDGDTSDVTKVGRGEYSSFYKNNEYVPSDTQISQHMYDYFKKNTDPDIRKISKNCQEVFKKLLFDENLKDDLTELHDVTNINHPESMSVPPDHSVDDYYNYKGGYSIKPLLDDMVSKHVFKTDKTKKEFFRLKISTLFKILDDNLKLSNNVYATKKAKIPEGANIAIRNVAASRLANLLGIGSIVVPAQSVILKKQGMSDRFGVLMDKASGVETKTLRRGFGISGEAQRQLTNLEIFDFITGQIDRHSGNYLVTTTTDHGKTTVTGIQGIDNDMGFGEIENEDLPNDGTVGTLRRLPAILDQNGDLTLPFMDNDLASRIQTIDDNTIKYFLTDILSQREIDALLKRLSVLKTAIRNKRKTDPNFFKDSNDPNAWGDGTYAALTAQPNRTNYVRILDDLSHGRH